jgi:Fe-S cluster biosynthesis and repair protein YggX
MTKAFLSQDFSIQTFPLICFLNDWKAWTKKRTQKQNEERIAKKQNEERIAKKQNEERISKGTESKSYSK